MSQDLEALLSFIALYTVWLVWPLVPAVLIYRLFPSTTVAVTGPLAGLTVKAGGAFAAYLVVFAGTSYWVKPEMDIVGSFQHSFWTIKGRIQLVNRDGKEIEDKDLLGKIRVRTDPDQFTWQGYRIQFGIPEINGELPQEIIFEFPDPETKWGKRKYQLKCPSEELTCKPTKTQTARAPGGSRFHVISTRRIKNVATFHEAGGEGVGRDRSPCYT
jgi:hypothetical protein